MMSEMIFATNKEGISPSIKKESNEKAKARNNFEIEEGINWFVVRGPEEDLVNFGTKVVQSLKNAGSNGDVQRFTKLKEIIVDGKYRVAIESYPDGKELIIDGRSLEGDASAIQWFNQQILNVAKEQQ